MGKKSFKRKLNPDQQQTKLYDKITFVQTKIINRINILKKTKNSFNLCDHLTKICDETDYDQTINYYDRYWKEYLMTVMLIKKMQEFEAHVEGLQTNVAQIEKKFIQREAILNLPALAKVKKPISKLGKLSRIQEKEEEKDDKNQAVHSSGIMLKKEEEVEPHMINYQSSQNQIFYE